MSTTNIGPCQCCSGCPCSHCEWQWQLVNGVEQWVIIDFCGGGDGATMDHMELEKEKGITITSAATSVDWYGLNRAGLPFAEGDQKEININLIDKIVSWVL